MNQPKQNKGVVWVNGQVTDFESAHISLDDRGFVFGDGVYEVIRTYESTPFAMAEHLARLQRSASEILLPLPMTLGELEDLIHSLVARAGIPEAEIYIQVTRGVARRNHLFPEGAEPTMIVGVRQIRQVSTDVWDKGVGVITLPDQRWARCDLKTIGLLPNVLAKEAAHKAGAFEALLVRDELVTEATSANVFLRLDDQIVTPVSDNRILPGITRAVVLGLARDLGFKVVERDIRIEELSSAHEVFLSSTTIELISVVTIDGNPVGSGVPGEYRAELHAAFRRSIQEREGRSSGASLS